MKLILHIVVYFLIFVITAIVYPILLLGVFIFLQLLINGLDCRLVVFQEFINKFSLPLIVFETVH